MPTVINNPTPTTRDEGGWGFVVGIILIVVLGILFFLYGLPALRNGTGGTGGGVESTTIEQDTGVTIPDTTGTPIEMREPTSAQ